MYLKFNKENWSGEQTTIRVNQKTRSWEQSGYTFSLRVVEDSENATLFVIKSPDFSAVLGVVTKYKFENVFQAGDGVNSVIRFDDSPYIAASKFLFNVI